MGESFTGNYVSVCVQSYKKNGEKANHKFRIGNHSKMKGLELNTEEKICQIVDFAISNHN